MILYSCKEGKFCSFIIVKFETCGTLKVENTSKFSNECSVNTTEIKQKILSSDSIIISWNGGGGKIHDKINSYKTILSFKTILTWVCSLVVTDLRSETKSSRFEFGCYVCAEVSSLR